MRNIFTHQISPKVMKEKGIPPNVDLALDAGAARLSRVGFPPALYGPGSFFGAWIGRIYPGDVALAYTCEGTYDKAEGAWMLDFEFRSSSKLSWRDPDDEDADLIGDAGTFGQWFADLSGGARLRFDDEFIPFSIDEVMPEIELMSCSVESVKYRGLGQGLVEEEDAGQPSDE